MISLYRKSYITEKNRRPPERQSKGPLTDGSTSSPILIKFALPLVAGNVFQLMYTFFDTAATIMVIFGKTILTVFVSPGDADGAQAALWFFRFLSEPTEFSTLKFWHGSVQIWF